MEAESFKVISSKKADLKKVYGILSNVKGSKIGRMKGKIIMSVVERRNIKGDPDKLILIEFSENEIAISYSFGEKPPSFRRWEVIRKVLPIIELVSKEYGIGINNIFPILDRIVNEIDLELGKEAKQYYSELDKKKRELSEIRKKLLVCKKENEKLSSKIFDLSSKVNELNIKLRKYENLEPSVLKAKIMEWIKEHHGEIDISEFSKVYGVKETIVEEKINELIREGYLSSV